MALASDGATIARGGVPRPATMRLRDPCPEVRVQLAPALHRIGDDFINCYLVEEAGEVTVVDAGVPGLYGDLVRELAAMGRTIDDVRALVLTHGHSDHIGFAERVRDEHGIPVSVHELDAALARGEVPNPSAGMGEKRLGSLLAFLLWGARRGALRIPEPEGRDHLRLWRHPGRARRPAGHPHPRSHAGERGIAGARRSRALRR